MFDYSINIYIVPFIRLFCCVLLTGAFVIIDGRMGFPRNFWSALWCPDGMAWMSYVAQLIVVVVISSQCVDDYVAVATLVCLNVLVLMV